jgi:probable HAF family extracellular repeat protein
MTDLGTLPGGAGSTATGINASGQIVGYSGTADVSNHAFLYSNGIMTDLGTLGGNSSAATAINSHGEVVGYADSASGTHAFLYFNGVMIDLDSLLPTNPERAFRFANAINDSGQIAGYIDVGLWQHAILLNLTTLSPNSATAEGASFTLTVNRIGAIFVPGATVRWNGEALATTYVSATEMTASVPASLLATEGTASVTVTTTAGTLAGTTFAISRPRGLGVPGEPERPRQAAPREQQ